MNSLLTEKNIGRNFEMKTIVKSAAIILALFMAIGLSACITIESSDNGSKSPSTASSQASNASKESESSTAPAKTDIRSQLVGRWAYYYQTGKTEIEFTADGAVKIYEYDVDDYVINQWGMLYDLEGDILTYTDEEGGMTESTVQINGDNLKIINETSANANYTRVK